MAKAFVRRSGVPLGTQSYLFRLCLTSFLFLLAVAQPPPGATIVPVRYGYFSETRHFVAACARGWFDLDDTGGSGNYYQVGCYPQSSGNFVSSRLDSLQLDVAHVGSTPWAQAVSRGVHAQQIYVSHAMGESQGIYVRPDEARLNYTGIVTPYDLRQRRIGVPFGSTTHYQTLFLIQLLGLQGTVDVVDMSPKEIMNAWDADPPTIDAAACWGTARDHILEGGPRDRPANTLLSSGVISDWGRSTFVVVAATRTFAQAHPQFIQHFVGVASRLADSFIDFLGETDERNVERWEPQLSQYSLIPSMVDALMLEEEVFRNPSVDAMFHRRLTLDLFEDNSAEVQISCQMMGGGPGECLRPTEHHWAIQETAKFLVDQKVLASLGPMANMGSDTDCLDEGTFCGSDTIDGSFLRQARTDCLDCLPVGPYAGTLAPVSSSRSDPDFLLAALEAQDEATGRSMFASVEAGREDGDSICVRGPTIAGSGSAVTGEIGDGANGIQGRSYSDDLTCEWVIRGADCDDPLDACNAFVEIEFERLRLWSGDFVRIYSDPFFACGANSPSSYMVAQATGFDELPPTLRLRGCARVVVETDSNIEKSYAMDEGDGVLLRYNRNAVGCTSDLECSGFTCNRGLCQCDGEAYGADCSFATHCFGSSQVLLQPGKPKTVASSGTITSRGDLRLDLSVLTDSRSLTPESAYPNDSFCSFEIEVPIGEFIKMEVLYDLEPTYDLLSLFSGIGSDVEPVVFLSGTHSASGSPEVYYIPIDSTVGFATIRFESDARGRRRGFTARLEVVDRIDPSSYLYTNLPCPVLGQSGLNCEIPHCVFENNLASPRIERPGDHDLGRIVSQSGELSVPAMPWAPSGGCNWAITPNGLDLTVEDSVAIRMVFNRFDLEAFPPTAVGDKMILLQKQGEEESSYEVFVEECEDDETCSYEWQTGECNDDGRCLVKPAIDIPFAGFSDSTEPFIATVSLITDRNDQDETHFGLDVDVLFVRQCALETACVEVGGTCEDGLCYCGGIACACSCDGEFSVVSSGVELGVVLGILVPVSACLFVSFFLYRRRKQKELKEKQKELDAKEAELEQFRNSVVGMQVARNDYVPKGPKDIKESAIAPPKVQWCWKETDFCMENHDEDTIYGQAEDCWIKYPNSDEIESACQNQRGKGSTVPLPGYVLDFDTLSQTKQTTGFQRAVQRFVEQVESVDVDVTDVEIGEGLPFDLAGEPQMILVKGDIIQVSNQREDGWAFGTKLHHQDEAKARQLLSMATSDEKSSDESELLTDTGWFPLEQTERPSGEDLAVLQSHVGDTGQLMQPENWDPITDPTIVQLHGLKEGDPEREAVVKSFLRTLVPPNFNKVKIVRVQRVQNLAMWQSYVVKRQTICYRETHDISPGTGPNSYEKAIDRFERRWLWHGTNFEVMDKILQQGFNRSFCGKNATIYGKGVYFARDASYSAYKIYSVPDKKGIQYMMACRVVVGEYCKGKTDALTPDLRDASKNMLYDSTVGLLGADTMTSPSIYVTYHDSQAYPEYLIAFKTS